MRIGATKVDSGDLRPYASTLAGVGARQEIFDFGRIAAQSAAADAAFTAERDRADQARLDVKLAIREAYFAVHAAKRVFTAADSAWQDSKLNFDTAQAGVQAGLREPIELTRASAESRTVRRWARAGAGRSGGRTELLRRRSRGSRPRARRGRRGTRRSGAVAREGHR